MREKKKQIELQSSKKKKGDNKKINQKMTLFARYTLASSVCRDFGRVMYILHTHVFIYWNVCECYYGCIGIGRKNLTFGKE